MTASTLSRRMNDHPAGRLAMTVLDIVILALGKTLRWLYVVQFPHKRTSYSAVALAGLFWMSWDTKVAPVEMPAEQIAATFSPTQTVPIALAAIPATGPAQYDTGVLAGRSAGDLYSSYMGYEGSRIPEKITISWSDQLADLWERKYRRRDITNPAREVGAALVAEYGTENPGLMRLTDYQVIAATQATAICEQLNWAGVQQEHRLTDREGRLLQRLSCNMGGRALLAYSMTELLPSSAGNLNRDYLDFLLQNAGRRYVESLPAVYDGYASFGSFQFTQFAIFDAGGEQRGASRVNQALPESLRIPGSAVSLRGDDHLKAAYLFAVHNLAMGIHSLNGRQVATLEVVGGQRGVELAQYLAVAHNKPANGRKYLRSWLEAGGRGSFIDHCRNSASRLYATKTRNNYNALSATHHL